MTTYTYMIAALIIIAIAVAVWRWWRKPKRKPGEFGPGDLIEVEIAQGESWAPGDAVYTIALCHPIDEDWQEEEEENVIPLPPMEKPVPMPGFPTLKQEFEDGDTLDINWTERAPFSVPIKRLIVEGSPETIDQIIAFMEELEKENDR